MDLIDASNAPEVPTVDPITGNPIVSNTAEDATMDNAMEDQDVDMDTAESAGDIVDTTRTVYLFESMACDQKSGIIRNLSDIAHAWDIASPAAAFPYAYHPDPDTHNWGHALLTSLSRLAQMTQVTKSLQAQAIQHVVDHVQERNEGLSALEGDHVLRVEDIQYSIAKMRPATTDSYRPRGRGGHGGRNRGRGRGGRGRGYHHN